MKFIMLLLPCLVWAASADSAGAHEEARRLRVSGPPKPLVFALEEKHNVQQEPKLPKMPKAGNPFEPMKTESKRRVMDAINKFRAEVCYRMKVDSGIDFGSYEKCEKFMKKACNPGKDKRMDGDHHEVTSGEGYCREFFPEAEKKAKEQIEKEDEAAAAVAPGPAPPPGIAAAPGPSPTIPAALKKPKGSPAPAPATMAASPAGAPTPARFIPGKSGGKPYGEIGKLENYYYKKGGKDPFRLHMDENLKLPTQGYWGKLVSHDDMETATGDWGQEFGAKANLGTYESHCRNHCEMEWCIRGGYCESNVKSSSMMASTKVVVSMLVVMFVANLF